jgi:hypothetical protein
VILKTRARATRCLRCGRTANQETTVSKCSSARSTWPDKNVFNDSFGKNEIDEQSKNVSFQSEIRSLSGSIRVSGVSTRKMMKAKGRKKKRSSKKRVEGQVRQLTRVWRTD